MAIISTCLTLNQVNQLLKSYNKYQVKAGLNELYRFKVPECTIIVYNTFQTVFSGNNAELISEKYQEKIKQELPQVGSDEVGTGDYFGPVVVVSAYLDENILLKIKDIPLSDSKTLTDANILEYAPALMKYLTYSLLILPPEKYNKVKEKHNLNSIKALLHNQALLNLKKKLALMPKLVVVDQFTTINSYFNYLKNEPEVFKTITFKTKAESKYLAVAAASIIARYAFLKELDKLSETYKFNFPKGAGKIVDEKGKEFYLKNGDLSKVAKIHFKNTSRIID